MAVPTPGSVFGNRRRVEGPSFVAPTQSPEEVSGAHRDDEAARVRRSNAQLGNPELPIADYRDQITEAIDSSRATIVTAETGAGKSTQIPQFLAEDGYEVIVTQPRIVAARTLSERVRDEVVSKKGTEYADFVGYRTARERDDDPGNQILFVTDGLQLVRGLSGNGTGKKQVLVLDEVHEWNENMEVLVAWSKKHMREDPNFKVAVMSATMESDKLANYFAGDAERDVPVIEVPGRTFEVKKTEGGDVSAEAIRFAKEGKNALVFVPGKAEIEKVMADVERARVPGVVVLPLHGQLDKSEQKKVFGKYDGAKIVVATNVAQTSLTIDDIDAVVDSGLERQNRVKNGVEGLYLNPISQADCLQRAGRAGRTKNGEYVLAQLDNNKFVPFDERESYGTPEILRTRLDGTVLRLAKAGFDAAEMGFYNVESRGEEVREKFKQDVVRAKERLQKLGALREDGSITKIGRDMDRMPVESHYARMMIEARKYSPAVRQQLAAMLAVQESDGVTLRGRNSQNRWTDLISGDTRSDMIVELEVMIAAQHMSYKERKDHDIMNKNFSNSQNTYRQLRRVDNLPSDDLAQPTDKEREQLVKCIAAGMVDNLYMREYEGYSKNGSVRSLSDRSVVRSPDMVVGMPFDLQIQTRRGPMTLKLIESVTGIPSTDMLREVAPQLFSEQPGRLTEMQVGDLRIVGREYEQIFNGQSTGDTELRPAEESEERREFIIEGVLRDYQYSDEFRELTNNRIEDLQHRAPDLVKMPNIGDIREILRQTMPIEAQSKEEGRKYLPDITIDDVVSPEMLEKIEEMSPLELNGYSLRYRKGIPTLGLEDNLSDDEVLALDSGDFVLPDGREIKISTGWYGTVEIQKRQEDIKEDRRAKLEYHKRQVKEALEDFLVRRYSYDDIADEFSAEVTDEAYELYKVERQNIDEAKSKIQTGMDTVGELSNSLREIDNAETPDAIIDYIGILKGDLSKIESDMRYAERRIDEGVIVDYSEFDRRLHEINVKAVELTKETEDWKKEEAAKATKSASMNDIADLAKFFNAGR